MKTKVVCIGDSITEGFGVEPEESYPAVLQTLLGEDYQVFNQGVCCTTVMDLETAEGLMGMAYTRQDKYREALAVKGDIYVILLGTNDAQDGKDDVEEITYPLMNMISRKEEFYSHYEHIVKSVMEASPEAQIYVGIPIPVQQCIWRKHQEKYLQLLIPDLLKIVEHYPSLKKIDVHAAFEALPEAELKALYSEDNLHPNQAGYRKIAETVYAAIGKAQL